MPRKKEPPIILHHTTLKDALNNMHPNSGASNDYAQGLVVGVVSALMAIGFEYRDAITQVALHMPRESEHPRYTVPESWLIDLIAQRNAMGEVGTPPSNSYGSERDAHAGRLKPNGS